MMPLPDGAWDFFSAGFLQVRQPCGLCGNDRFTTVWRSPGFYFDYFLQVFRTYGAGFGDPGAPGEGTRPIGGRKNVRA